MKICVFPWENQGLRPHRHSKPCKNKAFCISKTTFTTLTEHFLKIGDKLRVGFNGVLLEVIFKDSNQVLLEVLREGIIENNKGVDCINRFIELDDFTEKDMEAIALSNELNIPTVYISFCNNVNPIRNIKKINPHLKIISKIETRLSIHNLEEICLESDGILIDRGDLSRYIDIPKIPLAQRIIINDAKKYLLKLSPLCKGEKGDLMRRYLRWKK